MRLHFFAAASALLSTAASAQEPVEFKIKLLKDASWKVEQTVDFSSAVTSKMS